MEFETARSSVLSIAIAKDTEVEGRRESFP